MSGALPPSRLDRLSPERRALLEKRLRGLAPAAASAGGAEGASGAGGAAAARVVGTAGDADVTGAAGTAGAALEMGTLDATGALCEAGLGATRASWSTLVATGAREAERLALAPDLVADAGLEPRYDGEAVAFVAAAWRRLGVLLRAGDEVTVAGLVREHRVLPRYRKALRRWLDMFAEEGVVARQGEVYRAVQPLSEPLPQDALIDDARREYYGENLVAVLTGKIHPLEFYLAGGSSKSVEEGYREQPIFRYCNGVAGALLAVQVAALPPGRRFRLLEVGAGTGGTTASLLPLLPAERTVYVFTDVSKFFTDLGAQKFGDFPFVRYRELDIERDPVTQGLPAGCCDWLVAAHVLHATRNVHETLVHVRRLLSPGGVLLLLEETRFQRKYHFSMGFLPGFDHFEDYGLRPAHPLLSAAQWCAALRAAGFAEAAAFTPAGSAAEVMGVDVLLARAEGGEAFERRAPAVQRTAATAATTLRPRPPELVGGAEALSFAQHRLWRLARVASRGTAYNVFHGVRLRGRLQVRTLAAALGRLVARHEALRTRFPETEQGPAAVVEPASGAPRALPLVNLGGLAEPQVRLACERAIADQAGRPFDLVQGPLLRAALMRTAENEHLLLLAVHHIVIDGWSLTVLVRDLFGLYAALTSGDGAAAPARPPALQAGDFARWQRELLRNGELDGELAWWRRQLADAAPGGMRWPAPDLGPGQAIGGSDLGDRDHRRQGGRDAAFLEARASAALKALARRERATLFVVVLAAWKAVLHRRSGQDDVLVGTVVALRDRPETAELVGFLLNLLVLRTRLGGDPPFVELLARVRETAFEALTHQRVPFEHLAAELAGAGAEDLPTPWIRGLFIMPTGETAHAAPLRLPALEVEPTLTGEMGTEFEWTLYARESDGGIRFDLGYSPGVFLPGQAAALLGELTALLERAAADPGLRLSQLAPAVTAEGGEPGAAGDLATAGAGL